MKKLCNCGNTTDNKKGICDGCLEPKRLKDRVVGKLVGDYTKMNAKDLLGAGFIHWDNGLFLIPIGLFGNIPDGTRLTNITEETQVKGKDVIDDDTRGGVMAYGIKPYDWKKWLDEEDKRLAKMSDEDFLNGK